MEEIIFYSIATSILILSVLYLVWDYSAKDVPLYIKILTFISWILTFSIALILPIDIANSAKQKEIQQQEDTQQILLILWRIIYWGNFFLSWIILPFFQDYEGSGDFTIKSKIKYSLKKNLIIYGSGLIGGICLIIYLLVQDDFNFTSAEAFLIGISNFFGLLLVVLLLGQGLVVIPKKYLKESNEEKILEECYQEAKVLEEQKTEKVYELEEVCRVVLQLLQNEYSDSEFTRFLMIILQKIPSGFQQEIRQHLHKFNSSNIPDEYKPLNLDILGKLHSQVNTLMFDLQRINTKFRILSDKAFQLEKKGFSDDETQFETKWKSIIYKINIIWVAKIRKYYYITIGIIFIILSIFILMLELFALLKLEPQYNIYNIILTNMNRFFLTELFLLIPLLYMIFCTYYGLFCLKITGLISFNKNHHTDAPSLMFGSINFCRISFPLGFNFIQMTQMLINTSFVEIVKPMEIVLQGYSFLLPLMLLIMCVMNIFNVGDKLVSALGLSSYSGQTSISGMSIEGKKILDKEREERKKQIDQSNNQNGNQSVNQELQIIPKKSQVVEEENQGNGQFGMIKNFNDILNI